MQVRKSGGAILYKRCAPSGETWQAPADQTDLIMTVGNAGGLT
ncbi:RodZ domain-containing protein [Komagataeibacter medellinensis]|nr:RodZ domain-containing protein [Komagataeibacter medellinensis]